MNQALIIIDVQKDFCEGGVLPASNTLSLIEPLNKAVKWASVNNVLLVFVRDWHPVDHCSFNTHGGPWPPHCVQGSKGAEFAEGLYVPDNSVIIDIEKEPDAKNATYSAFENTPLDELLKKNGIAEVFVTGIATDYCVRATALDSYKHGYETTVLTDLIRPIDVLEIDADIALDEMQDTGILLVDSSRWME